MERLILNLRNMIKEIINLEDDVRSIKFDMTDTLNHVSKMFSIRQFNLLRSLDIMQGDENIILISRSMFEGAVYIKAFYNQYKKKGFSNLANDWRNFAIVLDRRRLESEVNVNITSYELEFLESERSINIAKEFGNKTKWTKNKTIKDISTTAKLDKKYDEYYSPMSDYCHWGTRSFGDRYRITDDHMNIEEQNNNIRVYTELNSLCIGITSLFIVLDIFCDRSNNVNLQNKILEIKNKIENIDGIVAKYLT